MKHTEGRLLTTDVLVLGGGLSGCMACLQAREHGVDVVLMEKSAVRRSGDAGVGMDHIPNVVHPRFNEMSIEELIARRDAGLEGLTDTRLGLTALRQALWVTREVEKLGVKVRDEDGSIWLQQARVAGLRDAILYRGADLKIKLASEVRRRGTKVLERTMLNGLLTNNGRVIGATGVNVRTGELVTVLAKVTILATGGAHRLYWHPYGSFPSNLFLLYQDPQNCGDGLAAAFRAGARTVNVEFGYCHTNTIGIPRGLTLTWYGLRNSKGEELLKKYSHYLDQLPTDPPFARSAATFHERRDLVTWDPKQITEEGERHWDFMMANERVFSLHLARDLGGLRNAPRLARIWQSGVARSIGGVLIDPKGRTSLEGLYAAGDVIGGSVMTGATGAKAWGLICGGNAAEASRSLSLGGLDERELQEEKQKTLAPLGAKGGIRPLELENSVRQILTDYVGLEKHAARMEYCLEVLGKIREKFLPQLAAETPHELMRALELRSILDVAELHTQASLIRTETRLGPWHNRVDYPEQDDERWSRPIVMWYGDHGVRHTLEVPWNDAAVDSQEL